ncbi:DUF833-domain-containing protein [Guyanagaster necrorhizus]|uniref:DUF833-domain-containing protein n=1 Tax=Guyanagaster necrorhizus TaxID=856835 RepID=A0A9P8AT80_9AGAR|nr:DUF833-domain-containing protein [Guyanagaster necrorhizus MCA 3950]KAG7445612.1 DUF833-domain-containing protein [Guyanagaster necrorhizus MCA 3950]
MCIAFWTLDHPDYALILCTNRDEFLDRPTLDARFHSFGHDGADGDVLSGIDVLGGGTWFGVTRAGRIALLTNITEPPPAQSFESRGALVSAHLLGEVIPRDTRFAGFNMLRLVPRWEEEEGGRLAFDGVFVSNAGAGGMVEERGLREGQGGFSNAVDGEGEEWDKVREGKQEFARILESGGDLVEGLFRLLGEHPSERVVHRSELKKAIQVVPMLIEGRMYATRLSTVVLVGRDGSVLFVERDIWKPDGTKASPGSQRLYRFQLDVIL